MISCFTLEKSEKWDSVVKSFADYDIFYLSGYVRAFQKNGASKNGFRKLHLGGEVGSGHDSLYKFKKAFNRGADMEFHIGKKFFNKGKYEELCKIRNVKIEESSLYDGYFPKYRGDYPNSIKKCISLRPVLLRVA